jgi:phosphate uptake regulator
MKALFQAIHDLLFPPAEKMRAKALTEAHRLLEHYTQAHEECEAMIGLYQKRIARLDTLQEQP